MMVPELGADEVAYVEKLIRHLEMHRRQWPRMRWALIGTAIVVIGVAIGFAAMLRCFLLRAPAVGDILTPGAVSAKDLERCIDLKIMYGFAVAELAFVSAAGFLFGTWMVLSILTAWRVEVRDAVIIKCLKALVSPTAQGNTTAASPQR